MRIALGGYLLIHFVLLIPYAGELFSSEGALGDTSLSPFFSGITQPVLDQRSFLGGNGRIAVCCDSLHCSHCRLATKVDGSFASLCVGLFILP